MKTLKKLLKRVGLIKQEYIWTYESDLGITISTIEGTESETQYARLLVEGLGFFCKKKVEAF